MDNFRGKGGYSNYNNIRNNNRNCANRPNDSSNRFNQGGNDGRKRKYNIVSNNRNVPKRIPNGNNIKKQVSTMYGNICNTMQKKFNMTLYKNQGDSTDSVSNNVNRNKNRFNIVDNKSSLDRNNQQRVRYNRNFNNDIQDNENRFSKRSTVFKERIENKGDNIDNIEMDEGQQEIPKVVFIFITIALVIATALMWKFMKESDKNVTREDSGSNVASQIDGGEDDNNSDMSDDFDGDNILSGDDETEEDVDEENGDNNLNKVSASQNNKENVQTVKATTKKPATGSNTTTQNSNKPASTKKPSSSNIQNDSTNQEDTEKDDIFEDEEMAKIALDMTGDLYRCSSMYGSYGTERFSRYTNFTNDVFGLQVPKKDLSGIWLDVKNNRIIDYVGYSSSGKVPVYKITIRSQFNSRVILAKKGASVPLLGGKFKEENGTGYVSSPLIASRDIVLVEY